MAARFDKYDPVSGGFRAKAAVATDPANFDVVRGVALDAQGRLILGGAGNSGFAGVTVIDRTKRRAGDVQDVMTHGEIVDVTGLTAGTAYYLNATGALAPAAAGGAPPAGAVAYVGRTVEAWRLVVRFERSVA